MVLGSKGAPDFKKMVKSLAVGDIVQTSDSLTSEANKAALFTDIVTVPTAGTAVQLPAQTVTDGFEIVIKALNSNTAPVHLADSATKAQVDADSYQLQPSEFVVVKLSNVNELFVDANVNGEGVTIVVEVD